MATAPLITFSASGQTDGVPEAVAALQRGDLPAAEQILHATLRAHPNAIEALAVLAVVLDQQKKFTEAAPFIGAPPLSIPVRQAC